MLEAAQPVLKKWQAQTTKALIEELKDRDVDWTGAPSLERRKSKAQGSVSINTNFDTQPVQAGQKARVTITVKNTGKAPYSRLYIISRCDNGQFDNHEFLFGRIEPGEVKLGRWTCLSPLIALLNRQRCG